MWLFFFVLAAAQVQHGHSWNKSTEGEGMSFTDYIQANWAILTIKHLR